MPFIGKQPEVGAYQLIDSITTSATDTYALTVDGSAYFPASARNLIVSLNGVTQAPESAYTVSGSNIVFAAALTASDVIDYIMVIGDAVDIGTPSDGTVGNAQLASNIDLSGKTLTFSNDQISGDAIDGGTISSFASTGIDDNATGERLEVNDGNVIFKANSGSNSHVFGYNEDGGEIILYDEAGATATLIDQAVNSTRLLELINGSDLLLGLGGSNSTGVVKFMSAGYSEAMRLDVNGRLGLGTTNPSPKFHVTDINGGGVRIDGGTASSGESAYLWHQNGRARFGYDGGRGAISISDYNQNGSTTGKHICFDTGGSERMRLLNTGSLLIGKTTANVAGADGFEFLYNGTVYATVPNSSTNTYHLYNRSTASYLFYVKGNGGISNVSGNNTNLSDERSKKGIVDSGEWLNKLCQIPVRAFRYNHEADSGKMHIGVVSQEVEAVAPELVEKNSFEVNGEARDSVYSGDLQFAMLKAIQEQQAIIEDLQTRLSALEAN